jgi:hypothetical protein
VLPFFHIYGMQVILNLGLERGATIALMPRFDLPGFLGAIQEHKVNRAYVVPPIALALAKHPLIDDYDLSSLDMIMSGAAPLGPELEEACAKRLGCRVLQGYGMTELSPVTHVIPMDGQSKPGSIGPSVPNTESRIVDVETGKDVELGERGELWIRGPQVMKGYLNNDEATKETDRRRGWLHTGDVAIADEDGYLTIVDRVKELIKFKGFQVAPAELEALLVTHPPSATRGHPGPRRGGRRDPQGVLRPVGRDTPDEIMEFVAGKVSSYKKVRQVEIVDEIPKSRRARSCAACSSTASAPRPADRCPRPDDVVRAWAARGTAARGPRRLDDRVGGGDGRARRLPARRAVVGVPVSQGPRRARVARCPRHRVRPAGARGSPTGRRTSTTRGRAWRRGRSGRSTRSTSTGSISWSTTSAGRSASTWWRGSRTGSPR